MTGKQWLIFFISMPLTSALACAGGSEEVIDPVSPTLEQEPPVNSQVVIDPVGDWIVTDITGSIEDERIGGGVEILCDYFSSIYNPIQGSAETFVRILEKQADPDLGDLPQDLFDAKSIPGDDGGVFIFSFAFSNGYHSNQTLEDLGVQAQYSQLIPEAWDFSLGVWTGENVEGEIQLGAPGGGKSIFSVSGRFVAEDRIEGAWTFEETTALPGGVSPECNTAASGEGTWDAQKQ